MEYTSGDWKAQGSKIEAFGRGTIAICPRPNDGGTFEFIANAHLIAQAPRMAKLLEYLVNNGWNASVSEEAKEILATIP